MSSFAEFKKFISNHIEADDDYTGGVEPEMVQRVEKELNVKLPESYKWFLENFGRGGSYGVEIYGVIQPNILEVVDETKERWARGMPKAYIVIENVDEFIYCIDTSSEKTNGEYPVIWYSFYPEEREKTHNSFHEFLLEELKEAKRNFEE